MTGLTAEQIAERRLGIGGSDAKRVMDGDWPALWREKMGIDEPEDLSGILAVQMGIETEALNARWFARLTGREVTERNVTVISEEYPFMRANLDGVTTTQHGDAAYIDFKHVGQFRYGDLVLRYTPQMVHCCTILELDHWVLSILIGNSKHEIIEGEVDIFYRERLIAAEREFWSWVEAKAEPPDMREPVAAPKPQPRRRNVDLNGGTWSEDGKTLIADPAWPNYALDMIEAFDSFERTHGAATVHAISRENIKKLLPDDVGTISRGNVAAKQDGRGVVISLKDSKNG